jgi:hypothetical protein
MLSWVWKPSLRSGKGVYTYFAHNRFSQFRFAVGTGIYGYRLWTWIACTNETSWEIGWCFCKFLVDSGETHNFYSIQTLSRVGQEVMKKSSRKVILGDGQAKTIVSEVYRRMFKLVQSIQISFNFKCSTVQKNVQFWACHGFIDKIHILIGGENLFWVWMLFRRLKRTHHYLIQGNCASIIWCFQSDSCGIVWSRRKLHFFSGLFPCWNGRYYYRVIAKIRSFIKASKASYLP